MVGVGIIRTSLAGLTMSLTYTKIPGILGKCGAMLGSLVKAIYLTKSRCKYAIRYIKRHENSLRKESLARKLVDKKTHGILERGETYECEQYSASHMH